jgi:hypothetical protein
MLRPNSREGRRTGLGHIQTKFGAVIKPVSWSVAPSRAAAPHMAAYAAKTRDLIASRVIHVLSPT